MYTPNENFYGCETFQYKVIDSCEAESVIESEIWGAPVNDIPVMREDIATGIAEDSIWNKYSISGCLTANDVDADDVLSIKNAKVVSGSADDKIANGYLQVKPGFGEDYVEIEYTVTDGNGGNVVSRFNIPTIREHDFAPEITNVYATPYNNSNKGVFSFLVQDKTAATTGLTAVLI